jgi:hypothetical protein
MDAPAKEHYMKREITVKHRRALYSLGYVSVLSLLVLCLGLGVSCNKGGSGTSSGTTTSAGGAALVAPSAFSFKTLAGTTETSSKYLGKPLVVNFWADW